MNTILLLNGPNLSRLGKRNVAVYGTTTLEEITNAVQAEIKPYGFELVSYQSNSEGCLVDALEKYGYVQGAIINPGALMMYGWSFRDALEDFEPYWIEVHISNIAAREQFRHQSILSSVSDGTIYGFGVYGYNLAAKALCNYMLADKNCLAKNSST